MHDKKHTHTRYAALVATGLMVLFLLAACGSPTNAASGISQTKQGTTATQAMLQPTPTTSLATILPLLQKAIQAEKQLHTARVTIQAKGTILSGGAWLPAIAKESTYTITGQGAVDFTKQEERLHVHGSITPPGKQPSTFLATEVLAGQRLYFQAGASKWFVINLKDANNLASANGIAAPQPQDLLQLVQHINAIDHGIVTNNKQRVHQITITLDQQGIATLAKVSQQPMLQQSLAGVHILTPVSADLFLDEKTSLLQQVNLHGKVAINADTLLTALGKNAMPSGGQAPTARTITLQFDASIVMSKLNQPVNIQVPAHATPLALTANPTSTNQP
jgi:flagellar basal body-associated protein FliL